MKISIITPWHNCPELIPDYAAAVFTSTHVWPGLGVYYPMQLIIIDNASDAETAEKLKELATRKVAENNDGVYIRNDENKGFAYANNQGLAAATGDIVVFLNSDVRAHDDWKDLVAQAKPGTLYSPSYGWRMVDGTPLLYLEGWCLFGHRADFERIGGWNDKDFPKPYWEDNELCWRASRAGLSLKQVLDFPLEHLSNYTSSRTPGAYEASMANQAVFERIVREGRNAL